MLKELKKIALVIPCHNESSHIANLLSLIKKNYKNKLLVIVVDDGSADHTASKAKFFTKYVLKHQINLGKGAALKTGCDFAFNYLAADFVITMDADEQHSPADIDKFISKIKSNKKLILGVRSFVGMPKMAVLANKLSSYFINFIYGSYIPDIPSGYKAFSKSIYQDILWKGNGYEVELEIAKNIAKKKISFQTVPIQTIYPNYIRGMTVIDGFKVLFKIIGFR